MSGIFKAKLGSEDLRKGASYKPGSGGISYEAASTFMEQFLAIDLIQMCLRRDEPQMYGELVDLATSFIEPHNTEEFNPQGFLDAVIHRLAEAGEPEYGVDVRDEPDYLIDSMLQALYNLGYNNLVVDPMYFPYPPEDMASYLHGEADNPLTFSYNGSLSWLGNNARHCRIKAGGGVKVLGKDAESSVFYVKSPIEKWTANPEDLKENRDDLICIPLDFFDKGNKLYVPDGKGDWKGLTLEDGTGLWWQRRMGQ